MISLGYQLNSICNQLKSKLLGAPLRVFFIRLFEEGRPTIDLGHSSGGSPKKRRKEEALLFACLVSSSLASSSILLLHLVSIQLLQDSGID